VAELNRQLSERRARGGSPGTLAIQAATVGQWTLIGTETRLSMPAGSPRRGLTRWRWILGTRMSRTWVLPGGGVWKTIDGGVHWTAPHGHTALGCDWFNSPRSAQPRYPSWQAPGDNYVYGDGLLRSTNAGASWTFIPGSVLMERLLMSRLTSAEGRVIKSNFPFTPTNDPDRARRSLEVSHIPAREIYRSTDNGLTWATGFSAAGSRDVDHVRSYEWQRSLCGHQRFFSAQRMQVSISPPTLA